MTCSFIELHAVFDGTGNVFHGQCNHTIFSLIPLVLNFAFLVFFTFLRVLGPSYNYLDYVVHCYRVCDAITVNLIVLLNGVTTYIFRSCLRTSRQRQHWY